MIKKGIYLIKITNCCPCSYCVNEPNKTRKELAQYDNGIWNLFGTDVGITIYEEVIILYDYSFILE